MNVAKQKLQSRTKTIVSSEEILPTVIKNNKLSTHKKVPKSDNKHKRMKTNPRKYTSHQPLPIHNRNFPFSDFKFKQPKKLQNTSHINLKKSLFDNESLGSIGRKLVQDASESSALDKTCNSFDPKITSTPITSPSHQIVQGAKHVSSKEKACTQVSLLYPKIILEELNESESNRKKSKDEFESDFFNATAFVSSFELQNTEPKIFEKSLIEAFEGEKDMLECSILKSLSLPSPRGSTILETLNPLRRSFELPQNPQAANESFFEDLICDNQYAPQSHQEQQNRFLSFEEILFGENRESSMHIPLFETKIEPWSTPKSKSNDIFDTSTYITSFFNSPKITDRRQTFLPEEMLHQSNKCDQRQQMFHSPKIHYEGLLGTDDEHIFSKCNYQDLLRTPPVKSKNRNDHLTENMQLDTTSKQFHNHVNPKGQNPPHFNRNSNTFSPKGTNISSIDETNLGTKWERQNFGPEPDPDDKWYAYHQEVIQRVEKVIRSIEKDLKESPTFKYSPRKAF